MGDCNRTRISCRHGKCPCCRFEAKELKVEITVLVADATAATAMETKLKPATFKSTLVQKISTATGIATNTITAELTAPVVSDTAAPSPSAKKGVVSGSSVARSSALMMAVAVVLNVVVSQY